MNNLKKIRTARGMSQAEAARGLNISRQAYYNYETGKREADYETLLKLGELFGCTVEEIISQDDNGKEKATDTNVGRKKAVFLSYSRDDEKSFAELLRNMSDDDLKQAYEYALYLYGKSHEESK